MKAAGMVETNRSKQDQSQTNCTHTPDDSALICVNSSAGRDRAGVPDRHSAHFAPFSNGTMAFVRLAVCDFRKWLSSATTTPQLPGLISPLPHTQRNAFKPIHKSMFGTAMAHLAAKVQVRSYVMMRTLPYKLSAPLRGTQMSSSATSGTQRITSLRQPDSTAFGQICTESSANKTTSKYGIWKHQSTWDPR